MNTDYDMDYNSPTQRAPAVPGKIIALENMVPANPLFRMLTACCAATLCSTAAAQNPDFGERVGFAGAQVCAPERIRVPPELKNAPAGDEQTPIHLEADEIETEGDRVVILRGRAEVIRGKRGLYAERIVYDRDTRRVNADQGVVVYSAGGDEIRARTLDVQADTFVGEGSDVQIRVAGDAPGRLREDGDDGNYGDYGNYEYGGGGGGGYDIFSSRGGLFGETPGGRDADPGADPVVRARATARAVDFAGAEFQRLRNVTMTTCAEGNRDVLLSAGEIELDHAAGFATARSMTVKFKNTPIFYFPRATFPINDQRKTGFLFPSAGYDDDSGALIEAPYYINIAPRYDATLTPRLLSKRGAQLFGEFRYLGAHSRGRLRGEFLPSDNRYDDRDRYALTYDHRHDFGDRWRATVDWRTISDSAYPRDFAGEVDVVASSYVPKRAALDYFGNGLRFSARVAAYDSANDAVLRADRPYETLPRLDLELTPRRLGPVRGGVQARYDNFRHDDDGKVHGARLRIKPYLSLPLVKSHGYIEPKISLQTIRYRLDDPQTAATGLTDDSPSANVPIYSLHGGLFFERPIEYRGVAHTQTLEPRLLYVNIPEKRTQREFPDFDTSAGSGSGFAHYFRENRFFGGDRVGDTEQVAVGVTSRLLDRDTGRQRLKLSLGQVFYLRDRKIGLTRDPQVETEDASGVIGEVSAAVSARWSVTGFARRADRRNRLAAARLSADYRRDRRRNATVAYAFDDVEDSEQVNFAFQTPLGARWQLHGGGAYSLEEDKVRSAGIGLGYDGCCWAARVAARRYLDGEGEHKNRLVFTFELDDLGRIRSQL